MPEKPRIRRKHGLGPEPSRSFRCGPEAWAEIQRRAKRAKKSVSAYLRDCALTAVAMALVVLLGCASPADTGGPELVAPPGAAGGHVTTDAGIVAAQIVQTGRNPMADAGGTLELLAAITGDGGAASPLTPRVDAGHQSAGMGGQPATDTTAVDSGVADSDGGTAPTDDLSATRCLVAGTLYTCTDPANAPIIEWIVMSSDGGVTPYWCGSAMGATCDAGLKCIVYLPGGLRYGVCE
jgi:hypothetical protein